MSPFGRELLSSAILRLTATRRNSLDDSRFRLLLVICPYGDLRWGVRASVSHGQVRSPVVLVAIDIYPFEHDAKAVEQNECPVETNSRPFEPKSHQVQYKPTPLLVEAVHGDMSSRSVFKHYALESQGHVFVKTGGAAENHKSVRIRLQGAATCKSNT